MLMYIGIGVVVLFAIGALVVASRPDSFRVARSMTIASSPDVPFAYVNDFHQWAGWSPFEKLDPNMQRTFSGSPAGVGAGYGWSGNSKAGRGSMKITESTPGRRVALDLFFEKPFRATNLTEFTFTPAAEGVTVEWAMSGTNSTMGKVMGLVMNMDDYIGKAFTEGLTNLKRISEA